MALMYEADRQATRNGWSDAGGRESPPALVARLIEGEIIPRLLLAHRNDAFLNAISAQTIGPAEVECFVPLVLDSDVSALLAHVEAIMATGISLDAVYIDLLGPAARALGEWWERDACDFIDVTMGLWRLQQVVHELATRLPTQLRSRGEQRRAFFTVAPGSQHSFGLVMIEEFFRRAGWQTWSAVAPSAAQLVAMVERQWLELVGFTVSCAQDVDILPGLIASLRRASTNPSLLIMVGGQVFNEQPALALVVGADATAADGRQAVATAERMVANVTRDTASRADDPG